MWSKMDTMFKIPTGFVPVKLVLVYKLNIPKYNIRNKGKHDIPICKQKVFNRPFALGAV